MTAVTHTLTIITKSDRLDERLPITTLAGAVGAICTNGQPVRHVIQSMLDGGTAHTGDTFAFVDADGRSAGSLVV
jgi:hypothetical protein